MITRLTVLETIEALLRHSGLLERIGTAPVDRREIAEAAGVSRSAADRAIAELESLGLLHTTGGRVGFTLCGRLATEEVREWGRDTYRTHRQRAEPVTA